MEPLIAAGGWCAPTGQVYNPYDRTPPLRNQACPDWDDPGEVESCVSHSAWSAEVTPKGWHSCKDEYHGPHDICVCEDCGAQRVILKES